MKKRVLAFLLTAIVSAGYGQKASDNYPLAERTKTTEPLKISGYQALARADLIPPRIPAFYYERNPFLAEDTSMKQLKRQLTTQKTLKGVGIFNIVWGGAWFGAGTTLTLMSSENRLLGIIPAAIGAGACIMGIRRVKISRRKIRDLREQISIRAGANTVALIYGF
ncbi:hypothetical protein [Niabella beijingensis]|uniref:hypothetical protein n=1 Tax=Niabella beijingensis TaxID=2872700 RepID=UPI001CBC5D9F|nr:hypothetical protein [Niabella beijingensis]MBZ4187504.1 hypothetical protein [Niabella beijingensis]